MSSLTGCGSAPAARDVVTAADPASPPAESAPEPPAPPKSSDLTPVERERHIQDAKSELEAAERALDENLVVERTPGRPAPPRTPPKPRPPGTPAPDPKEGCERACVALGSMQRSVEHLCRLAGPTDARCRSGRLRLENAATRVQAAACGCEPII